MRPAGAVHAGMRRLPVTGLLALLGAGPALVLAPHADDESLGCGGLIAAACAAGRPPVVVVLTDGRGSHPRSRSHPPARLQAVREAEAARAVGRLGLPAGRLYFLREPDTAAPQAGRGLRAVVRRLAAISAAHGCASVLAPWRHDPHCDHLAAHLAAVLLARRLALRHLSYPVWGLTLPAARRLRGGAPRGWRLPVGPFLARKRAAVAAHASQHGRLITDDPGGFALPAALLEPMLTPWEIFLEPAA